MKGMKCVADQKIENLLELSIGTPEELREKSENLSAGYSPQENTWQIIVRYSGDAKELQGQFGQVTPLLAGYAILVVTETELEQLSQNPRVQFIEKPKALYFAVYNGKAASCIPPVQRTPLSLTGAGVLVGLVDSGIDILHPDFRNEDGTTRLAGLWDQTEENGSPPEGYPMGSYYSKERLNEILASGDSVPGRDLSGHGTHVAGIAAGNGRASRGENRGVAFEADILAVKLHNAGRSGDPLTTGLMMGVDFCVRESLRLGQPLALNLSYGNSYGSHQGNSLLETYLDAVSGIGKTTICVGSGNEGNKRRHAQYILVMGQEKQIEFAVAPGERELSIQIWKQYVDDFQITLLAPSGSRIVHGENAKGEFRSVVDETELLWFFGEPAPYSRSQEIYLEMLPVEEGESVRSGIWKIQFMPQNIVDGKIELWMPSGGAIGSETGFLISNTENTLTIPSTAAKPITVGAYNSNTGVYASFSGRGRLCCNGIKPDLSAPGVDIVSCAPGGGYTARTGTSMACPFVTGSAALLMQYGIIQGRDPFLYGEKIKAYLSRGAKRLPGQMEVPDPETGDCGNIVSS